MVIVMRKSLFLLPLVLAVTPAVAQPMPPAPPPMIQLPPELTDPDTAERLGDAMLALSHALLDMRVGEVRAAIEGREATPQERHMTVRDMARRKDPNFDRKLNRQIANVGPTVARSMNAVNQAVPAMNQALSQAQQAIERAVANLPDPTYPRR